MYLVFDSSLNVGLRLVGMHARHNDSNLLTEEGVYFVHIATLKKMSPFDMNSGLMIELCTNTITVCQ